VSFFGHIFSFFRRKSQPSAIEEELEERRLHPRINPRENTRVLVIDDSPTILTAMKRFLESAHSVFLGALDAKMGMEVALTQKPDMIFLDIVMPGINGFAALRALRKNARTRDIPIVMMSGNEQAKTQFFGAHIGADDFMKKPFSRFEVFAHIARLLDEDRVPRRPPLDLYNAQAAAELQAVAPEQPRPVAPPPEKAAAPQASRSKTAGGDAPQLKPAAVKPPPEPVVTLAQQPARIHPVVHAVPSPAPESEEAPTLSAQVVSITPASVAIPIISSELLNRISRLAQLAQSDPEALKALVVLSSQLCAQFIEANGKTLETTRRANAATAT
jgi:twitching motility two-component system response regulator PilH